MVQRLCTVDHFEYFKGQFQESMIDIVHMWIKEGLKNWSAMQTEMKALRQQNDDLTRRLDVLERKTDELEGWSKRTNLIFYGLPQKHGETPEDCEHMVKDLIKNKLELSEDIQFVRVHRINSKPDSPVIARCVFYKQKTYVLNAKAKLQGTNITIGADVPLE